jgi:hypothetical protein
MLKVDTKNFVRLSSSSTDLKDLLGPLAKLAGTWSGSKGWNIIAVPSPGSTPDNEGDFQLLVRPYTETMQFIPVQVPVRNRGGAVDQFVGALEYNLRINDAQTNELLHIENGMYLYLENVQADKSTAAPTSPKFSIARSATIPHGDSVMVLGTFSESPGAPSIPDISTLPPDIGKPTILGYLDPYNAVVPGLNVPNPNDTLRQDLSGLEIQNTTTIALDTANSGGITNIPFINSFANATRMKAVFWIETVQASSTQLIDQLQYSQIIDLEFHKKFGKPGLITWPHVNINTLKKQ